MLERLKNKYNNLSKEEKDKKAIYVKNWYNNLAEDKENIKREYSKNRYQCMSSDEKLKLKEYQRKLSKNYREKRKRAQGNFDKNAVLTL